MQPGYMFRVGAVISLVGGTMFLLWLGEQITSRGIGNGVSLIIMAGIVAQFPTFTANLFEGGRTGSIAPGIIIGFMIMVVVLIIGISLLRARTAPIAGAVSEARHAARHDAGGSLAPSAQAQHRWRYPADFRQFAAAAAADDHAICGQFGQIPTARCGSAIVTLNQYLQHGQPLYMTLYGLGIIFFTSSTPLLSSIRKRRRKISRRVAASFLASVRASGPRNISITC